VEDAVVREWEWRADAPFVERARIVHAVDLEDRYRATGSEALEDQAARDRSRARDPVGGFGSEPMRHHPAIRVTGDIDAVRIHRRTLGEIIDHREEEADVVHPLVGGVPAASPGIPGEQGFPQAARPVGIDREEPLAVGDCIEPSFFLELVGVSPAPVECEDYGTAGRSRGWDMDQVRPRSASVLELDPLIARSQRPRDPGPVGSNSARTPTGQESNGQDCRSADVAHGPRPA